MLNNEKENIYQSIDDFFKRAIKLKNTGLLEKYFKFMSRVPYHAPFNNSIVFMQNPECGYYATASQWENRFNRSIRDDARPMVILLPFAPVGFVYDIEDTEGKEITDDEMLFWWRENGGILNNHVIEKTVKNLKNIDINIKDRSQVTYFEDEGFRTAGYVQKVGEEINIALHPKYDKDTIEKYGVLCHEIAHMLLGHLGYVAVRKNNKDKKIAKDRSYIPINSQEVEAELTAWVVFNRLGFQKKSESYIASWLSEDGIDDISISEVVTVANKIFTMGNRIIY